MNASASSLAFVGHVLAACAYALLTVLLLRRGYAQRQAKRLKGLLLAATGCSLVWACVEAYNLQSDFTAPAYAAAALDVVRYGVWIAVLRALLLEPGATGSGGERSSFGRTSWVGAGLVAAGLVLVLWRSRHGLYAIDDSRASMQVALGLSMVGLVLVEQVYRNVPEEHRWALKPLLIGLGGMFAFDLYLFAEGSLLGRVDTDVQAVRPLVHALVVPLLALSTRRSADWVRSLQVSRRAVFYSATLLLAGGYLLFMAATGYYVRYFGGEWGRALQVGLLFVASTLLLLLLLSASLRARVRVLVSKHFFSYRYDYREEWLAFTAMLSSDSAPQEVSVLVVRALANIVECPAGALWALGQDERFRQMATWNLPQRTETEPADSSFSAMLREKSWVVDVDEARGRSADSERPPLPAWLESDERAWAVVPLAVGGELLGFVVLGRPRTPVDLDWETRDLLRTASRQAAGYLAQMKATEALLESRKFDAFNRMSAFVVHDLKNIITQLSLMMKNARRLRDNPEFQEDMLLTVESSLERMKRMMLQLREGATPPGGSRGVELVPVLERLVKTALQAGRTVELDAEPLATRGHDDRLERVLGHLVQNALDATPRSGRVWVRVDRHGGQVRVEVGDTGQGMTEEFVRTRLFKPFSSTKRAGMGIGSYESAQYIRELGGTLDVESEPGRGTLITVLLPLFDSARRSDLMPLQGT